MKVKNEKKTMEPNDERDQERESAEFNDTPSAADIERRFGAVISRLARRFFQQRPDADEALREAYSQLPFLLEKHDDARPFPSRLKTVVGRFFLDCLRAESAENRRKRMLQERLLSLPDEKKTTPDARSERQYVLFRLRRRLDELAPTDRALLIICAEDGESLATAAEVVGLSPDTARNRLFRLRRMLRREFADELGKGDDPVCCLVSEETLERRLAADLEAMEMRRLDDHLSACENCRNRLHILKNEWRLIAESLDLIEESPQETGATNPAVLRKTLPWLITAALTILTAVIWHHTRPKMKPPPPAPGVAYVAKEPDAAWFFHHGRGAEPLTADFVPLQRVIIARSGAFRFGVESTITIETPAAFAIESVNPPGETNRTLLRLFEGRFSFFVPSRAMRLTLLCGDDIVGDIDGEFSITVKPADSETAEATQTKKAWNMNRIARMNDGTWKTLIGISVLTGAVTLYDRTSGEKYTILPELESSPKQDPVGK